MNLLVALVRFTIIKKSSFLRRFRVWRVKKSCAQFSGRVNVGGHTILTKNTYLGDNVNFNGLVINGGGKVVIGDHFHSGTDCLFISQNHNYNNGKSIPYDDTYTCKDIIIGDCVWLGSRVIVLGGVEIGEGAIVQAGSCVVNSIPDYAIAGGHPATVFAFRDIEHFKKLKLDNKFH